MFHFDRGLKLTSIDLAIDVRRRQPRGFISHAHMDHMARHELAFCTRETSHLYQFRFGRRPTREMPYRQPLVLGDARLTTYPAGHCLGSAMLLAEIDEQSLLYTGDFKLGPSATAEPAEFPRADILVMESTFGDPQYRLPPRAEVAADLVTLVRRVLAVGSTPVIHAYVLGKAQEVTRILSDAGIPVLQHPLVHEISRVYEACGCRLGDFQLWPGYPVLGHAVVAPPIFQRAAPLARIVRRVTIAVTGWAADPLARRRLGVDHALPLSDHADYEELLEAVRRVNPRVVYCTHGPESFAGRLQDEGIDARVLGKGHQGRLF
jgi:Cft2 family RNA processing exonuclease